MSDKLYQAYQETLNPRQILDVSLVTAIDHVEKRLTDIEGEDPLIEDLEAKLTHTDTYFNKVMEKLMQVSDELSDLRDQVTKIVYDLYDADSDPSPAPVPTRGRDRVKRHTYTEEQKLTAMYNQINELRLPLKRRRCVVCGEPIAKGHKITCKKEECRLVQHATANMRMLGWTDEKVEQWHHQHPGHPEHMTIIAGVGVRDADRS